MRDFITVRALVVTCDFDSVIKFLPALAYCQQIVANFEKKSKLTWLNLTINISISKGLFSFTQYPTMCVIFHFYRAT